MFNRVVAILSATVHLHKARRRIQCSGARGALEMVSAAILADTISSPRRAKQDLVRTFSAAQRLYPVRTECLERSTGLATFLLSHGYPASIHLAVCRIAPHEFHCWVESEDACFGLPDSHASHYVQFTPLGTQATTKGGAIT